MKSLFVSVVMGTLVSLSMAQAEDKVIQEPGAKEVETVMGVYGLAGSYFPYKQFNEFSKQPLAKQWIDYEHAMTSLIEGDEKALVSLNQKAGCRSAMEALEKGNPALPLAAVTQNERKSLTGPDAAASSDDTNTAPTSPTAINA